jgi:hypothetical protein
MRFTPKTDEELYKLLAKGEYDFEVLTATEKTSKAGNDMIEISCKVFGPDKEHTLKDWLLDNGKLKRFCESTGNIDKYDAGEIHADELPGWSGKCKVDIESVEGFNDRNKITGYVTATPPSTSPNALRAEGVPAAQTKAALQRQAAGSDPDVPF